MRGQSSLANVLPLTLWIAWMLGMAYLAVTDYSGHRVLGTILFIIGILVGALAKRFFN